MHEDERLLIGGLQRIAFKTIRNIAQSENYNQYIKALGILEHMSEGMALANIQPYSDDIACLKEMIDLEISTSEASNLIPKYVQTLFHHYLMKKTKILINLFNWNTHCFGYYEHLGGKGYGYKKFSKLFGYNESESMFDFSLFIKIFPNVKAITVANFGAKGTRPSLKLSQDFVAKMFDYFKCLSTSSKSLSLSRFEIIVPKSSINEFIESNQNKFEKSGWTLKDDKWVDEGIFSFLPPQKMLLIQKMSK